MLIFFKGLLTYDLSKTGNEIGLNQTEVESPPSEELETRLYPTRLKMQQAGAHFVANGIWGVPYILRKINALSVSVGESI